MNENDLCENKIKYAETEIRYDLTVCYTLYEDAVFDGNMYSVEAVIKGTDERAYVRDITRSPKEARYIFDMISRGGVTPCCIFEITEDLIEAIPDEICLPKEAAPEKNI